MAMKYIDGSNLTFGRGVVGIAVAASLAACGGGDDSSDSTVTSAQVACESLTGKTLDGGGTVTAAESIAAGTYVPPNGGEPSPLTSLPAFCRVTVTKQTSPESKVAVEVWLPKEHWNGRFLGTGNGGPA